MIKSIKKFLSKIYGIVGVKTIIIFLLALFTWVVIPLFHPQFTYSDSNELVISVVVETAILVGIIFIVVFSSRISWWFFKLIGVIGILCTGYYLMKHLMYKNEIIFFLSLFVVSILVFIIGEVINYSNETIKSVNELVKTQEENFSQLEASKNYINELLITQKESNNKMTCPCCLGKGFIDLKDIERLGKTDNWVQSWCRYCSASGKVEKQFMKKNDPLKHMDYDENWFQNL